MKNSQKKSREGALYVCLYFSNQHDGDKEGSGISGISGELQKLVDNLNLLQSDVFAHCSNVKKELDNKMWSDTAQSIKSKVFDTNALLACMEERKEKQLIRQQKAKEMRKKKKQDAKNSNVATKRMHAKLLDDMTQKKNTNDA